MKDLFEKKRLILVGLLCLLSFFFNIYLFAIFIFSLVVFSILIYFIPGRFNHKFKVYLDNGAIVLFSLFLIVLIIEGYLRLAEPKFLKLEVNTTGDFSDFVCRGYLDESVFTKPAGAFRILGLGDSFARNLAYLNKSYHDYLQVKLQEQDHRTIDIFNAGLEGVGPGYYWYFLKEYGPALQPDLVLVGVFVGNDLTEMKFSYGWRGRYGIKDYLEPGEKLRRFLTFNNWWLYQFVSRNLILYFENRNKAEEVKKHVVVEEAAFSDHAFLNIERERMWIFEKKNQPRLKKVFDKHAAVFLNMKDWCQKRQVPLIVAIFPDQFQVDGDLRNRVLNKFGLAAESLDLAYPDELLAEYCRQNQIHCIDMLADFQANQKLEILYRVNDTHFNESGNQLAAAIIYNYLQERQLAKAR